MTELSAAYGTPDPAPDSAVLAELGARLARCRLEQNLTQLQLAREAGVSKRTILRLESGASTQVTNLIRVIRALGLPQNLDSLIPPPLPSPIDQLATRGRERQRASGVRGESGEGETGSSEPGREWSWADEPGESREQS